MNFSSNLRQYAIHYLVKTAGTVKSDCEKEDAG